MRYSLIVVIALAGLAAVAVLAAVFLRRLRRGSGRHARKWPLPEEDGTYPHEKYL